MAQSTPQVGEPHVTDPALAENPDDVEVYVHVVAAGIDGTPCDVRCVVDDVAGIVTGGPSHAERVVTTVVGAVVGARAAAQAARSAAARRLMRFFVDRRAFPSIRAAYSQARGGLAQRGMSLHHWFIPQRYSVGNGGLVPDRFVNGGWNLLEISGRTNSLMSPAIRMPGLRGAFYGGLERGIQVGIPGSIAGSVCAGAELGSYAADQGW